MTKSWGELNKSERLLKRAINDTSTSASMVQTKNARRNWRLLPTRGQISKTILFVKKMFEQHKAVKPTGPTHCCQQPSGHEIPLTPTGVPRPTSPTGATLRRAQQGQGTVDATGWPTHPSSTAVGQGTASVQGHRATSHVMGTTVA